MPERPCCCFCDGPTPATLRLRVLPRLESMPACACLRRAREGLGGAAPVDLYVCEKREHRNHAYRSARCVLAVEPLGDKLTQITVADDPYKNTVVER